MPTANSKEIRFCRLFGFMSFIKKVSQCGQPKDFHGSFQSSQIAVRIENLLPHAGHFLAIFDFLFERKKIAQLSIFSVKIRSLIFLTLDQNVPLIR